MVEISSNDTQTGMLLGIPRSARCVQRFDDSLNSAIHITYRISLRSSSMREPRDPLLKVVFYKLYIQHSKHILEVVKNDIDLKNTRESRLFFSAAVPQLWIEIQKNRPGLQYVHSWRNDKDDKRAHTPKSQQQPVQVYSIMILPQVHLRKPCYDFYFL